MALATRRRRLLLSQQFSPLQIPGLKLWLQADSALWQDSTRTIRATADGDPVGSWDDLSGNANHATQATGTLRPTLKLNIQNGKPVIRFDGTDDILDGSANTLLTTAATIFVTGKQNNPTGGYGMPIRIKSSSQEVIMTWINDLAGFPANSVGLARRTQTQYYGPTIGTSFHVLAANYTFASNNWSLYYDGVLQTLTDNGVAGGATNANAIGSEAAGFLTGDLSEILLYDSVLNATERESVEAYLRSRWGTP